MFHLNLPEAAHADLYLDVQGIEPQGRGGEGYLLNGTLGDGFSEGLVLVEVGEKVGVTFVDELLGGSGLRDLFRRIDRGAVVSALAEAAAGMRFCVENLDSADGGSCQLISGFNCEGRWIPLRPAGYGEQLDLPLVAAEAVAVWERRAA